MMPNHDHHHEENLRLECIRLALQTAGAGANRATANAVVFRPTPAEITTAAEHYRSYVQQKE